MNWLDEYKGDRYDLTVAMMNGIKARGEQALSTLSIVNTMMQAKNKIKDQIISTAHQQSVNVIELDVLEGNRVRTRAIAQFAKDDSYDIFIWSNLPDRNCDVLMKILGCCSVALLKSNLLIYFSTNLIQSVCSNF